MNKFISLTILLVSTRFADLQTTYLSTPDLKTEANPLVSKFGMGWTGLIFLQIIFLMIIIHGLWVYCFKTIQVPIVEKGLSLNKFISLFYFNDTSSFSKLFYRFPTNKNSLTYSYGYILTFAIIFWSIVVSGSTYLLVINKSYRDFYISHNLWIYLYLLGIGLAIFFSIKFFKKEFKMRLCHD